MFPPFENNPEETGTKCFPWVARKRNNGEFTPCKLSKGGNGYPNVRFQITVEDLKEQGREDLIGIKKGLYCRKERDRWPRNEGVRGLGMTVGIHTLVGYALFHNIFKLQR